MAGFGEAGAGEAVLPQDLHDAAVCLQPGGAGGIVLDGLAGVG
ncbi:hypothetical protein [Streptomyces sp. NBC_01794]|nr:hypothetical protein OIE54_41480 [Streptomyces sp. NBC_01794]